jgi:hypothetical protein
MLFHIASSTRGVIVYMTGMSFSAFVGASGSIIAMMLPCRRLSHMGKQVVTFRDILCYDNKTLHGGV